MTQPLFRPATRKKVRGRIAFDGPSGSGKTFTALRCAFAMGQRVAVINTESGAVEKYLGLAPDGIPWQFDICELTDYAPSTYTSAILAAGQAGYDVLVIDSLSHAWAGDGGALAIVDQKGGNKFSAWKDVTPLHNRMVDAILRSPCHVIVTMRSKMEYILEESVNASGKTVQVPKKVGMAPVQRQGMEYEFDVVADMDWTHTLTVSKSRCPELDGQIAVKPGAPFFGPLVTWLNDGSDIDPSHFAVTEADLRASENARKAAAKERKAAEPKQHVDPRELAKAAAAKQSAATQPPAADPPPPEPPPERFRELAATADRMVVESAAKKAEAGGFATAAQLDRLRGLVERLAIPHEACEGMLRRRGVSSFRSLTVEQADELIDRLLGEELGTNQLQGPPGN